MITIIVLSQRKSQALSAVQNLQPRESIQHFAGRAWVFKHVRVLKCFHSGNFCYNVGIYLFSVPFTVCVFSCIILLTIGSHPNWFPWQQVIVAALVIKLGFFFSNPYSISTEHPVQ